jgi:hypothetical protein
VSAFSPQEMAYLTGERRLGRIATAIDGEQAFIRIHPDRVVSWGLGRPDAPMG